MKDAAPTIFTLPLAIIQPVRRVSGLCRGLLAELRKSKMAREARDGGRDGAGLDWRTDSVGELVGISARRRGRRSSTPDAATSSSVRCVDSPLSSSSCTDPSPVRCRTETHRFAVPSHPPGWHTPCIDLCSAGGDAAPRYRCCRHLFTDASHLRPELSVVLCVPIQPNPSAD